MWEALQGAVTQAEMLSWAGYPEVWEWGDRALLRAAQWLHEEAGYPAVKDDEWQTRIINYHYGSDLPEAAPAQPDKNVGWSDWTHSIPRGR